jgi:hypothetical protein
MWLSWCKQADGINGVARGAPQVPYAGLSEGDVRLRKLLAGAGLPPPVGCPPALAALLAACLAVEPAQRPAASAIAAELRAALRATWGGKLLWARPGFC